MLSALILGGVILIVVLGCLAYQTGIRKSMESTTIPLFMLNRQGGLMLRNSATQSLSFPTLVLSGVHYVCTDLAIYLKSVSEQSEFMYEFTDEASGKEFKFEGRKIWYRGQFQWLVSVRRQVDRASAEEISRHSRVLIHDVIQSLPDGIGMMDEDYRYQACNKAFTQALGINNPDDLVGHTLEEVASKEITEKFYYSDKKVLATGESFHIIDEVVDDSGNKQWLEARKTAYTDPVTNRRGIFIFTRDISEKESAKEKLTFANSTLKRLSYLDGLTDLANRRYFDETLLAEWQNHLKTQMPLTVVKCDIEDFAGIIEQYGTKVAEQVIVQVARILETSMLRSEDRVYRFSGEEYVLILTNSGQESAATLIERINRSVNKLNPSKQIAVLEQDIQVNLASYSSVPDKNSSVNSILSELDLAMHKLPESTSADKTHAA